VDYREHGRTFPNQRANAGSRSGLLGLSDHITRPRVIHKFWSLLRARLRNSVSRSSPSTSSLCVGRHDVGRHDADLVV